MSSSRQYNVLGIRDFRLFLISRSLSALTSQMQAVAVSWQIYELTSDPLSLGYLGLSLFIPFALFTLPAGDICDRVDRRWLIGIAHLVQTLCAGLFLAATITGVNEVWPYFAGMALFGAARAFTGPAMQSFPPIIVPPGQLPDAVAWSSSANQTANIVGPALGGVLLLLGPTSVFGACAGLFVAMAVAIVSIRTSGRYARRADMSGSAVSRLRAGIAYVRTTPILLGVISLDLFAVLLGGVTALLPVYARDILEVGPEGLGLLRGAPAVGAALTAFALANFPLRRHAGLAMFAGVALFGVATLVFGLSVNFPLSLVALALLGAGDVVSVVVRSTVVQLATPEEMRGRVSAVYMLFVGASNELGEFRAGVTAAWLGVVPAVVIGGIGTLAVVGLWTWLFPMLRTINQLADVTPHPSTVKASP